MTSPDEPRKSEPAVQAADARRFWRELLGHAPPALDLGGRLPDRETSEQGAGRGSLERLPLAIDSDSASHSFALMTEERTDEFTGLLAAFLAFLFRSTRQPQIVLGIASCDGADEPLPVSFALDGGSSYRSLVGSVRKALAAARENRLPLQDILDCAERSQARDLFQVAFGDLRDGALNEVDLSLQPAENAPSGTWVYDPERFERQEVEALAGRFTTLFEGLVAQPDTPIGKLPFLTADERRRILVEWNDKAVDFPREACLHQLFEARAEEMPEAVAVTFGDQSLSYAELEVRANQLAHHLRSLGVGAEVLVGISAERSFEMVIGLLAIAKAGGGYLPMDPAYPKDRLAFMVEDSQVSVILVQRHLADSLPKNVARFVYLDADRAVFDDLPRERPDTAVTSDNLAYVIYTSGSTGLPKGVVLNHQGRVNNFLDFNRRFAVGAGDALIALASLSFDMCAYDVFGTLAAGATIVLPQPEHMQDPKSWARLMNERRVTTWHTAPAMLKMLVDQLEAQPELAPQSLRLVLLGGDWIPVTLPDRLRALVSDVQVISMGGATECSMDSTIYEIREVDPAWTSIPYGEPMWNQLAYVLDEDLEPVPAGAPGELYLGGIGVGRGYLERPELTTERFLPNPFVQAHAGDPTPRMYRTGDLARWMPDGNLELLGRIDSQVKIRGYRIELGEIESRLHQHPAVKEGVVVTKDDAAGEKRLVAYVVQDPTWKGPEEEEQNLSDEAVEQWQAVYDNAYSAQRDDVDDPTFNIVSWDSSYTSEALPAAEMQLWVDQTVERIARHKPQRVLEIGCGMGLLLFRIAPATKRYVGTDFSKVALDHVRTHAERLGLSQVELDSRWADDFTGFEENSLDAVVLNSIILDFPDMDYLMKVLAGSVKAVAPGGTIFVGDVRSLPLLQTYQSSVQVFQAADDDELDTVRSKVQRLMRQEEELVIHPQFFNWLRKALPGIADVQVQLKRGSFTNELNAFRYDVTLYVGESRTSESDDFVQLDWSELGDLAGLRQRLSEHTDERLVVREIPNARVARDVWLVELMAADDAPETVGELRAALAERVLEHGAGIAPEDVWSLADELGLACDLRWAESMGEGRFDAVFARSSEARPAPARFPVAHEVDAALEALDFANNPMMGKLSRQLGPELKRHLSQDLPEYMVPTLYVPLEALPLSPNGKVDRKRLPEPDTTRPDIQSPYVPPSNPIEEIVAGIWTDVLGLDRVGVEDAFLELGGHSILAVQIQARLNEIFPFDIALSEIFEAQNVARLATRLRALGLEHRVDVEDICRMLQMIQGLSEEEIAAHMSAERADP